MVTTLQLSMILSLLFLVKTKAQPLGVESIDVCEETMKCVNHHIRSNRMVHDYCSILQELRMAPESIPPPYNTELADACRWFCKAHVDKLWEVTRSGYGMSEKCFTKCLATYDYTHYWFLMEN